MLAILLLTALLVIRTGPESVLVKALRRSLVDWPAKRLARLTRGQIICLAGFALLIWAGVALLGRESMQVMSLAMPDTLAWLAMIDLSVVVDALVATALIGAQARLGGTVTRLRARQGRRGGPAGPRARAPRRRREAAPKPANDEEPAPAWALTA